MKFAVSSYSLSSLVHKGEATEKELISVAKELGFDGIEFAEIHTPDGKDKREYARELKAECERVGIEPVQYSVGADFLYGSEGNSEKEIERLNKEKNNVLSEIERVNKKLSNEGFIAKAPAKLIEEEKAKKVKYEQMLVTIEERLAQFV